jgi:hypothetical protein
MQMKGKICLTGLLLGTNHGCITTNPNQSVLQCNGNIPVHLLVQPKYLREAGKVMLIVFWDPQGVLLAHFQNRGENINSTLYCEILLKFRDAIRRKHPGQLARGVLLHHGNVRPHRDRATQEKMLTSTAFCATCITFDQRVVYALQSIRSSCKVECM